MSEFKSEIITSAAPTPATNTARAPAAARDRPARAASIVAVAAILAAQLVARGGVTPTGAIRSIIRRAFPRLASAARKAARDGAHQGARYGRRLRRNDVRR